MRSLAVLSSGLCNVGLAWMRAVVPEQCHSTDVVAVEGMGEIHVDCCAVQSGGPYSLMFRRATGEAMMDVS